jgi:hypothetical protein
MTYKCDRCGRRHEITDYSKVKDKQKYVKPFNCYGGDYYEHLYYWFPCECGRAIKIDDNDIKEPWLPERDYTDHYGVSTLKQNNE